VIKEFFMKVNYLFLIVLAAAVIFSCSSKTEGKQEKLIDSAIYIGTKQYSWEDTSRLDDYYGGTRKVNVQVWYPSMAQYGE
jgi:hypothetical protein